MPNSINKQAAIQSYRTRLGEFLLTRHGRRVCYTTEQVRQGASELGLDLILICYAFAMFCTRDSFNAHHAATGRHCDYDSMQAEIAAADFPVPIASQGAEGCRLDPHGADSGDMDSGGPDLSDL